MSISLMTASVLATSGLRRLAVARRQQTAKRVDDALNAHASVTGRSGGVHVYIYSPLNALVSMHR